MRVLKYLVPIAAILWTAMGASAPAADWLTLPAAPPKPTKPPTPTEQRKALLDHERAEMTQDWSSTAKRDRQRHRKPFDWSSPESYSFHFNDSWNAPLQLPPMISPQDFVNIAPPLPPQLPGLSKPLGGEPSNNLPSPEFNHSHW